MTTKNLKKFRDHEKAFAAVEALYNESVEHLCKQFDAFSKGKIPKKKVQACYPCVRISTKVATRTDIRRSYGFVPKPGTYETTVTRPDLLGYYYKEQFRLLLKNLSLIHI